VVKSKSGVGSARSSVGVWLASDGGLTADPFLQDVRDQIVGASPAGDGGLITNQSLSDVFG
jgi:hypothetical protein